MSDRRGTSLGKYRLLERLGEGGMGTVYRARDEMLDRDVAIKLLRPDLVRQTALVERFRTEAIALARLAHPRIATLYGLEKEGEELYMVMEFLRGETLEDLVAREGRVSWRRAAGICAQVAEALDHAHDHGVIHRDIKPANIMIGPGDATKVMDFGIARMAGSSRQTRHGHSVGTPAYMAPEQLRGEECDGRTDLYALGAVFYELVTGKVAFEADSDYKLMMQQLNDPPTPPSVSNPELPTVVDRTVLRAMSKQPGDRFATAAAMRNALMEAAASVVTEAHAARDSAPATRIATAPHHIATDGRSDAGPVGVTAPVAVSAPPDSSDTPAGKPIWLDWRSWATVAMLALAVGLLARSGRPGLPEVPADTVPTTIGPFAGGPGTTPSSTGLGARPAPAPVGGGISTPPPAVVPTPEPVRRTPPPPAPTPAPPPERRSITPPPPAPEKAAEEPARDAERDATAAVRRWFESSGASGLTGTVDGQPADRLVSEKRLALGQPGTPSVTVTGNEATATVTSEVEVRSAFGSSKRKSARFTIHLSQASNGTWRVTRATVQG